MTQDQIDVRQHGVAVDQKKQKIKCNYCHKVVSGFTRLKYHLGGVRGDVTPCLEAPTLVKEAMKAELHEKKNGNLIKEVEQLYHPNLPLKRNWCPREGDGEPNKTDLTQRSENGNKKHNRVNSKVAGSSVVDSSSREISKSIGRFFYEEGIDFDAIRSPSFRKMVKATFIPGKTIIFPSCHELKGWILQGAVEEMRQYVTKIRNSWASTGCSILLDGWVDSKGRNLINILVYCPRGTIYLRSSDISSIDSNVDAMQVFFEEVIEEVGVENVVQIVAYSTSAACMTEAGKKLMEKLKTVFWTVDASHCMELMLQKFTTIDTIQQVLEKAKALTQFIYSNATVLKLLRDACPNELVCPSKIRSIVPFMTLENIVSQKEHLIRMFQSSDWHLASTSEGKRMSEMVEDESFWTEALMAVKATIPLVEIIKLLNSTNKPLVGFIYDTIDQAKETIKKEFKEKKSHYARFWKAIDDVWDEYLHSHLHASGYFLNPSLFYSSDFYTDVEVSCGLCYCVVRMTEDRHIQDKITLQIDEYRMGRGTFHFGSFKEKLSNISPAIWWSQYGGHCPELQRLAVRILSQTCNGASHYRLKRSLVEKLFTQGRNPIEQQRMRDLVFVHCNLQLQAFDPEGSNDITDDVIDPMDEWIVGKGPNLMSENTELTWKNLDLGSRKGNGNFCVEEPIIHVKEEEADKCI
ncbi:uncharacterized protein LOC107796009 [Nicotiana tabacum]|uniref:BED-type domain-containing protein n=7 Tax=Nicotiana tabacum TaxID=4097 RepID=A0A1S4AC80_TOBAC|nr:PREDICTED: uncharacterized protein LOC107796009 [Nicotiana tabacum]XP_016474214.1 PREDICTED: uncharacterized protein LOC107796009 [Nicotiana tabacum]XP_016474219.1 PREDICTED: uncharacterized protein LOC107796009 [Nicotiana tabacum]